MLKNKQKYRDKAGIITANSHFMGYIILVC